ncbi:MAG: hypothetical protein QOH43_4806 [Solirubrobacteraceae bacterium]|jgi:hypothetical protein|nr:hypothetical protein [Solirubrobacteraceae bacterium]
MKPNRTRLMGVAAALTTIAIAAPIATAGAATSAPAVAPLAITIAGPNSGPTLTARVDGHPATVVGPTFITSAPATFVNTNTQVSSGASTAGEQVAP